MAGRDRTGRFARNLDTAARDGRACTLRRDGATYQEIADRLGFSDRSAARHAVERALAAAVREPAAELRELELMRLDRLYLVASELLDGDDRDVRLKAVDRLVRISERRSRLLGLDAPTKIEGFTIDQIDAEIARLSAELGVGGDR